MSGKHVIAVDLGASSGRVMDVAFDGRYLQLQEIHRFPNIPVQTPQRLHWDVLRLWHEITAGIAKANPDAAAIGIDTWGVDYALLDARGELLANPIHYRDPRTDGAMEWVFERIPRREIFARTGIQFLQFNGLFQLAASLREGSPLLQQAKTLLPIADLFNYWLTGSKTCEFTAATTLQLYSPHLQDWDRHIMQAVGIPDILAPIVPPGTKIGSYAGIDVIAPACHDTGSAVVAVPATSPNYAYLSSGTWSLLGLEVQQPLLTDAAYAANVTNEGGCENTYRLLKNIMGLWVVDQCRAAWRANGRDYSFAQLQAMVQSADPFKTFIDPDDSAFLPPGDMPARVIAYCRQTAQPPPQNDAELMAAVYASLAYKYRYVLEQLMDVSGQPVDQLHIIGGGSQNALLNQMTANATGRPVIAGPAEATATGNAIVQLIAIGELADIAQARAMLSESMPTTAYEPQNTAAWEAHYDRFCALLDDSKQRG